MKLILIIANILLLSSEEGSIMSKRIKKIHRAINKHHIQNHKAAWECNYEEAVIDWECCRLTKPQEPMSAREYLEYKKETLRDVHYAHMDMIMKQFNL